MLNQLLNNKQANSGRNTTAAQITVDNSTQQALQAASANQDGNFRPLPIFAATSQAESGGNNDIAAIEQNSVNIVAYTDTNSLLVQGSARQVSFVEDLVSAIDIPKQQIQLSLWIIDVSKDDINELGVRWQGSAKVGNGGITFNTSSLTQANSIHFWLMYRHLLRRVMPMSFLVQKFLRKKMFRRCSIIIVVFTLK